MTRTRVALTLVLIGAAAVIAAALLIQHVGGLAPCELCLYERWPYYAAVPLAFIALVLVRPSLGAAKAIALLLLIVFLASAGLGFYHVGVEQHWFAGPTACTGTGGAATSVEQLRALLLNQQPVRCDAPQWSFHGVSLAALNCIASLILAALSLLALRARGRRR